MPLPELELADYRRRVSTLYADVRASASGAPSVPSSMAWEDWRRGRDELIATHPQSPLPAARRGVGWVTPFWPYDPAWRVVSAVAPLVDPVRYEIPHSAAGTTAFTEVGTVEVAGASLTVFWLEGYGGGLFLPFTDETCGATTYGGGRYLLDTVKGADLGAVGEELVLDFNYAYHPSCAWDSRWSCPLAPPTNRLPFAVEAGEQLPLPPH